MLCQLLPLGGQTCTTTLHPYWWPLLCRAGESMRSVYFSWWKLPETDEIVAFTYFPLPCDWWYADSFFHGSLMEEVFMLCWISPQCSTADVCFSGAGLFHWNNTIFPWWCNFHVWTSGRGPSAYWHCILAGLRMSCWRGEGCDNGGGELAIPEGVAAPENCEC